jgi:hypothetical protein
VTTVFAGPGHGAYAAVVPAGVGRVRLVRPRRRLVAGARQCVPVPGSAARAAVAIGLAAWRSVREGRPVRLAEMA